MNAICQTEKIPKLLNLKFSSTVDYSVLLGVIVRVAGFLDPEKTEQLVLAYFLDSVCRGKDCMTVSLACVHGNLPVACRTLLVSEQSHKISISYIQVRYNVNQ
jgi:hypothetical protein